MMTWRTPGGVSHVSLVWILPNGWLVTTSGNLYYIADFFPGVVGEDPTSGIAFEQDDDTGEQVVRLGLAFSAPGNGQVLRAVKYGRTVTPLPDPQGKPGKQGDTLRLVGSGAYRDGFDKGVDLTISHDPPPAPGYAPVPGWARASLGLWFSMTDLGTVKGGDILPHVLRFPASNWPGKLPDDRAVEDVFRQGL